jgi:hypothetical protein
VRAPHGGSAYEDAGRRPAPRPTPSPGPGDRRLSAEDRGPLVRSQRKMRPPVRAFDRGISALEPWNRPDRPRAQCTWWGKGASNAARRHLGSALGLRSGGQARAYGRAVVPGMVRPGLTVLARSPCRRAPEAGPCGKASCDTRCGSTVQGMRGVFDRRPRNERRGCGCWRQGADAVVLPDRTQTKCLEGRGRCGAAGAGPRSFEAARRRPGPSLGWERRSSFLAAGSPKPTLPGNCPWVSWRCTESASCGNCQCLLSPASTVFPFGIRSRAESAVLGTTPHVSPEESQQAGPSREQARGGPAYCCAPKTWRLSFRQEILKVAKDSDALLTCRKLLLKSALSVMSKSCWW